MKIKLTTEEFIKRAKLIHGDKFDYSLVNYTNFANKVIIRCKIHGEFTQAPKKHLVKQGCPKCNGKNKTTEELIEQFKVIHGSKYNYDKVIYKTNKSKIKMTKNYIKMSVYLTKEQRKWVRQKAKENKQSNSDVIRD